MVPSHNEGVLLLFLELSPDEDLSVVDVFIAGLRVTVKWRVGVLNPEGFEVFVRGIFKSFARELGPINFRAGRKRSHLNGLA